MIGILIVAHESVGESLIAAASHVLETRPPQLEAVAVDRNASRDELARQARELRDRLDDGEGVLVLSDMPGGSPCNVAKALVVPARSACVAGVNLPMLLRVLNYREKLSLDALVEKALSGGRDGVVPIDPEDS